MGKNLVYAVYASFCFINRIATKTRERPSSVVRKADFMGDVLKFRGSFPPSLPPSLPKQLLLEDFSQGHQTRHYSTALSPLRNDTVLRLLLGLGQTRTDGTGSHTPRLKIQIEREMY